MFTYIKKEKVTKYYITYLQGLLNVFHCITECVVFGDVLLQEEVLPGSIDDLVINVSDIHDINYIIVEIITQDSPKDVKAYVRSGMAHV